MKGNTVDDKDEKKETETSGVVGVGVVGQMIVGKKIEPETQGQQDEGEEKA